MSRYYKCQVLKCRKLTKNHLCDDCIKKILDGSNVTACSCCGSVLEIRDVKEKEVVWVENCGICKGKSSRSLPWSDIPIEK